MHLPFQGNVKNKQKEKLLELSFFWKRMLQLASRQLHSWWRTEKGCYSSISSKNFLILEEVSVRKHDIFIKGLICASILSRNPRYFLFPFKESYILYLPKKIQGNFFITLRSNLDLHVMMCFLLLHCWNQRLGRQEIILKTKHLNFQKFFEFPGEIKRLHQTINYCNRICGCCLGNTLLYILVFIQHSATQNKNWLSKWVVSARP